MSGRLVFDQNNNIKLPSEKSRKKQTRGGRNMLFVLAFIAICLIVSMGSCALTYNWLGIGWVGFNPSGAANSPLDDNELLIQNEELREQIGVLQAQVDQLEAQLEREQALRGNLPVGTGVTSTPQQPTPPTDTTPPTGTGTGTTPGTGTGTTPGTGTGAGTGTGTGTTPGTGAGTGTGTTPGTGTGTDTTPGTSTDTPSTGNDTTPPTGSETPPPDAGDDTVARPPAGTTDTPTDD